MATSRKRRPVNRKRRRNLRKSKLQKQQQQIRYIAGAIGILIMLILIFSIRSCIHSSKNSKPKPDTSTAKVEATPSAAETEVVEEKPQFDPVSLTISVVGDCTLGTDETFDYSTSVNAYYENYGAAYFMQNVKSIFQQDDLTIANFEGTLTESDDRQDKTFAFKAPPECAKIVSEGAIEAVNTANNHSHDYGDAAFNDTMRALDAEGIIHFGYDETQVVDVKGIKVGLIGIYELNDHLGVTDQLKRNIAAVKQNGAQLIIVIFHWGNELDQEPDEYQTTLGRLAIDEGADLVCGHHAHVVQGIETYKGKNIVYGLGNFCFGGNQNPSDIDSMIYQQTFTVTPDGVQNDNVVNIIPCLITSEYGFNNYQPTPATGDDAVRILQKIDSRSADISGATQTVNAMQNSTSVTAEQKSASASDSSDSSSDDSGYDYSYDYGYGNDYY